ncbi:hypothetical protein ACOMHN_024475 [Nucella lapillus]
MAFYQLQTQNDCKRFQQQKDQCLSGVDLSRKGSIDVPILDLVNVINVQADCFTTSSCSGRVIVVDNTDEHGEIQKQGCHWLYVTHEEACLDSVKACLQKVKGAATFKFEPLVMHIQVRTLETAQRLHATAVASGFRNSGISIGGKGKIVVAVRSTHCMEVPLSCDGQLLVSDKYLDHLVQCANKKMQENINRISRLFSNFKSMIEGQPEKVAQKKRSVKDRFRQTAPEGLSATHTTGNCESRDSNHGQNLKDSNNVEEYFDSLLFEEMS